MSKIVTAKGKEFTFDDNVTDEQIGQAVDEYFAGNTEEVDSEPLKKKEDTSVGLSTSYAQGLPGGKLSGEPTELSTLSQAKPNVETIDKKPLSFSNMTDGKRTELERISQKNKEGVINPDLQDMRPSDDGLNIDDLTQRTKVLRGLLSESKQMQSQWGNGLKNTKDRYEFYKSQFESQPSMQNRAQLAQAAQDLEKTQRDYNRRAFITDAYEKRLLQTSDSIKRLANENVPDGFFEGFYQGLKGNIDSWESSVKLAKLSKQEQIEYAKKISETAPAKEPTTMAKGGEMVGGVVPDIAAAIGFSLVGLPYVGATTVAVRQGAQQAADDFVRVFNQAKRGVPTGQKDAQGKDIIRYPSDDEAYDMATKAAGVGFGTGALEGIVGTTTGGLSTKIASRAATPLKRKLTEKLVDTGTDALIAGTMQTGRNVYDRVQGLDTKVSEGVAENMAGEIILGAPINIVTGRLEYKKELAEGRKKAIYEAVEKSKYEPEELIKLKQNIEVLKNQGIITKNDFAEINKRVDGYSKAIDSMPEEIQKRRDSQEIADLIVKRDDLVQQKEKTDEALQGGIDTQINDINNRIKEIVSLPSPEKPAEDQAKQDGVDIQQPMGEGEGNIGTDGEISKQKQYEEEPAKEEDGEPMPGGVQGVRIEGEGGKESAELRTEEEVLDTRNAKDIGDIQINDINSGNVVIGYHATPTGEIGTGKELGIHIGTEDVSNNIKKGRNTDKGDVKKVAFRVNKPLILGDMPSWSSVNVLNEMMRLKSLGIDKEKLREIRDSDLSEKEKQQRIIELAKEKGYDSFAYQNFDEGNGEFSYVLFDDSKLNDITPKEAKATPQAGSVGVGGDVGRKPIGDGKFVRYNPDDVLPLLPDYKPTNTVAVEDYVNQVVPNDASVEVYKTVPLDAIQTSEKIETKDRKAIDKIKEGIKNGDDIPPLVLDFSPVIKNGETYKFGLMDGHHRYIAYKELGIKEVPAAIVTSREHYTFETNDTNIKTLFEQSLKETPQAGSVGVGGDVMPKEISDLYSEAASLRFTLNALRQQMGGKTLVGKAKAEYENTKTKLDNIELKLSEYEKNKSNVVKATDKEQVIDKSIVDDTIDSVDSEYGNFLLNEIDKRHKEKYNGENIKSGLAKQFNETLADRGENRAISNLEDVYMNYVPAEVRADAYQALRKNFEKEQSLKATPQAGSGGVGEVKPASVFEMPVSELNLDPDRFQYKIEGKEETGATGSIDKEVPFKKELAGVISVWKDPIDGKTYVVNGHNRTAKAKSAGVESMNVMYINAETAEEARAIGALQNIADGKGTALDAAKYFRDTNSGPDELKSEGISIKKGVSQQGYALSKLSEPLFKMVVYKKISVERGVMLSEAKDVSSQEAVYKKIEEQEKKGIKMKNSTIKEYVDAANAANKEVTTVFTLFGETQEEKVDINTRMELLGDIREKLIQNKNIFGRTAKSSEILNEAGNKIDKEVNEGISREAAETLAVFDALKNTAPEINKIINESVEKIKNAKSTKEKSAIKSEAYDRIIKAVPEILGRGKKENIEGVQKAKDGGGQAAGDIKAEKEEPTIFDDLNNFLKGEKPGLMQADTDAMVRQFVEMKRKQGVDDNELRKGLEEAADKGIIPKEKIDEYMGVEPKVAPERESARQVIKDVIDNYYQTKEGKLTSSEKQKARMKMSDMMAKNPSIKYIFDKLTNIHKQLEMMPTGEFKKTKNCP